MEWLYKRKYLKFTLLNLLEPANSIVIVAQTRKVKNDDAIARDPLRMRNNKLT